MKKIVIVLVVLCFVIPFCLVGLLSSWTDTNLEYLAGAITGHAVAIPDWISWAIVIFGPATLLFNLIVTIIRHAA